jgi:ADP-ribose pyrophosphatase
MDIFDKGRCIPELPTVTLQLVQDQSPPAPAGFLRLVRRCLVALDARGEVSSPFVYDEVDRAALDAVVIAAHYVLDGTRHVYLRSAARPPVLLREANRNVGREYVTRNGLWELPAGLVEPGEASKTGVIQCAQRELKEELGFDVTIDRLLPLGPSTYPCPGVIAERHYFFHVSVRPDERREPTLDGSAIEKLGAIIEVPLDDALGWCRAGQLEDAKSELGLRRLAELPISWG